MLYVMSSTTSNIDWNDVIKKEARGNGDEDLGEVQEVGQDYVLVQRGMLKRYVLIYLCCQLANPQSL